jgi:hypothetical protein
MMADEKETNFKVTDRRKFNPDGSPRENSGADQASPEQSAPAESSPASARAEQPQVSTEQAGGNVVAFPEPSTAPTAQPAASKATAARAEAAPEPASYQTPLQQEAERAYKQTSDKQPTSMPPANFLAIVNMLAVEAGMHLGMVNVPGHEEQPIDLEAGRQLIDLLATLKAKTRGNLTAEEENLFEGLLADLRMQFVSLSRR